MLIRLITITLIVMNALPVSAATRIKDIGRFAGVRSNSLIGYGLVIGLNKTGDKRQTFFTQQSLVNMLERFGLTLNNPAIRVENIAAVMVTADLPAFERAGSRIDVTVSSIGDATSLQGGVLLQTPLLGEDGNVYAVGSGSLILGGFAAGGGTASVTVNHPTVGRIPNGGTVEREVAGGIPDTVQIMELVLDKADFTNAKRTTEAVNLAFGQSIASARDGRTVKLQVPPDYQQRPVDFIAAVEMVSVDFDSRARIVINERTGTVIIGSDVTISPVSIAHGNLSIRVQTQFQISQPQAFGQGNTVVVPEQSINADEQKSNFVTLNNGATVQELIRALNALGVTPRDTIAILEALKTAGSLQADLGDHVMTPGASINSLSSLGLGDDPKPKTIASKMQAMFMEVMLKTMEESVEAEGGLFGDSAGSEIYRGMFREQLAAAMSNQLQSPLRKQLEQELNNPSADSQRISKSSASEHVLPAEEQAAVTSEIDGHRLPVNGTVTSPEGWRRDPFNGELHFHRGTDVAAPLNTAIQAVEGGVVVESGPKGGYGNAVVIRSESGRRTLYGHNNTNLVHVGDRVQAGDTIAKLGATGRATGPHVHFEVME